MTQLSLHPACMAILEMPQDQYEELRDDIKANGLLVPIATCDGQILDGRHRYRACQELGIKPRFEAIKVEDPWTYVWSLNVKRRHLSAEQRGVAWLDLNEAKAREVAKSNITGRPSRSATIIKSVSNDTKVPPELEDESQRVRVQMAEAAEISPASCSRIIAASRDPDVKRRLWEGKVNATSGAKIAKMGDEAKVEALRLIDEGVRPAKAIHEARLEAYRTAPAVAVTSADVRIVQGDSRTFTVPEDVHCIVTDPPYGIEDTHNTRRGGKDYHDGFDAHELLHSALSNVCDHLVDGGHVYIFAGHWHSQMSKTEAVLKNIGLEVQPWPVIWDKGHHTMADPKRWFLPRWDAILFATKPGPRRHLLEPTQDILAFPRDKNEGHSAQKPVALLRKLISLSTRPGELVYDPFAGSGSTLIAAKLEDRRALGVEIDERFVGLARRRLA